MTPNLSESGALTDRAVTTLVEARAAAHRLIDEGARAVLIKGGHLPGEAIDLLLWSPSPPPAAPSEHLLSAPRLPGPTPRGTGCTLATAIAIGLARAHPLPRAVADAKAWLTTRIAGAHQVGDEHYL